MRILVLSLLLATPAFAETRDVPLAPLEVEPSIEARLVPAVIPQTGEVASLDAWEPTAMQIAAILGEDGTARESYLMAETFDDAPVDEDALIVQAAYDEM